MASSIKRVLTQVEIELVKQCLSEGVGLFTISRRLNAGMSSLERCLKELDISYVKKPYHRPKKTRRGLSSSEWEAILNDYRGGMIGAEVARQHGISWRLLDRMLTDEGVVRHDLSYVANNRMQMYPHIKHVGPKMVAACKHTAKVAGYDFDLTIESLEAQFIRQGGRCFYSNIPMLGEDSPDYQDLTKTLYRYSPDRRNTDLGYTQDNVVLCCQFINYFKNDWSEAEFRTVLDKVVTA